MKKEKTKSFVGIISAVALCALSLRIIAGFWISRAIAQNEDNALTTLKLISAALENFAKENHGIYPNSLNQLTSGTPPFLDKTCLEPDSFKGYTFSCPKLLANDYECLALPQRCKLTGDKIYRITKGGEFFFEGCSKK